MLNNVTANYTATNIIVTSGNTLAFNVGGAGQFTAANIATLSGLSTASTNGFENNSILGLDTTNAVGGNFTYGNAITNTFGGANALGLKKLGTNTLTLNSVETYTGTTTINGGTLSLNVSQPANGVLAGPVVINNTGTLLVNQTNALDGYSTANNSVTVNSGGTLTMATGITANTNSITLNGGTLATLGSSYTGYGSYGVHGIISATANSTITAANVMMYNGSSFSVSSGVNLTDSGTISDATSAGTAYVTKNGTGTLTLTGANTYTGGTTVNAGTLAQGTANAIGATTSDALNVTGGTFDLAGFPLLTTSLSGTGGSIVNSSATPVTLTNTGTTSTTLASVLGGTGGNNFGLTKNGTGTLTLNGVNTYSGGTIINAGTLAAGEPGAGGTVTSLGSGSVTLNTGGQLTLNGGGGAPVNENVTNAVVLNGGTLLANDGYQHLQGAVSVTGAGSSTLITVYPGKDISVDGVLSGSGALTVNNNINFQYAGEGITHFTNAANTYTGTITSGASTGIAVGNTSGGLISVDATNALQFASVVNNSGSTAVFPGGNPGITLTFQNLAGVQFGPSVTAATFGSLAGTGNFVLVNTNATPAAVALTAGGNNASTTYSGIISGTGSLTKTGSGALVLSGADTYSGATTITAGTLQVGSGGATPTGSIASSSSIAVGGGATLITAANGALNNIATAVNLGDGNGNATVQNGAFTGATAANNIQQAGALSLGLGTANILDFAGKFGTFDFGSGAAADPGGNGFGLVGTSLNVRNFGTALNESTLGGNYQLLFDNALTMAQLGDISFLNSDSSQYGAIQQFVNGTSGQVQILEGTSPAPEPAQTAALGLFGLGLGALVIKARKRSSVAAG